MTHNLRPVFRTDGADLRHRNRQYFTVVGFDMVPPEMNGGDHPEPVFTIQFEDDEIVEGVNPECIFSGYDPEFDEWLMEAK